MTTFRDLLDEIVVEVEQASQAAKDAEKMGLVKKPGFGLYGKPDGPVTHKSRGGTLQPVQGEEPSAEKKPRTQKPTVPDITRMAAMLDPRRKSSNKLRSTDFARTLHPSAQIMNTVDSLRVALEAQKPIEETFSTLTGVYNRQTAPTISGPGELLNRAQRYYKNKGNLIVNGIYDADTDTLEVLNNWDIDIIQQRPIAEWKGRQIDTFETCVHELLHSASTRLQMGYTRDSTIQWNIEEGLTQYLAYHITSNIVGEERMRSKDTVYAEEVTAIELMANHGGLNVDSAFREDRIREGGIFELDNIVYEAQARTVINLLYKTKLFSKEYVQAIVNKMKTNWENDLLTLKNPKFAFMLQTVAYFKLTQQSDIPPNLLTKIQEIISTELELPTDLIEQKTPKKAKTFLSEVVQKKDVEERSVWLTYVGTYGARNTLGQVRYFPDKEKATAFARGTISGPRIGRPLPKDRAEKKEKKQKYDVTPVTD